MIKFEILCTCIAWHCLHSAGVNCKLEIANCVQMHQKIKLARLVKLDGMLSVLRKSSGSLVFWYYCQKNYKLWWCAHIYEYEDIDFFFKLILWVMCNEMILWNELLKKANVWTKLWQQRHLCGNQCTLQSDLYLGVKHASLQIISCSCTLRFLRGLWYISRFLS